MRLGPAAAPRILPALSGAMSGRTDVGIGLLPERPERGAPGP